MLTHKIITSPLGMLTLVALDGILTAVRLGPPASPAGAGTPYGLAAEDGFEEAERQLAEYFEGQRCWFTLPTSPMGTYFQRSVWAQVQCVRYGSTASYKQVAVLLGGTEAACRRSAADGMKKLRALNLEDSR